MIYHLVDEPFSAYTGLALSSIAANIMRFDDNSVVVCPKADDTWGFNSDRILIVPRLRLPRQRSRLALRSRQHPENGHLWDIRAGHFETQRGRHPVVATTGIMLPRRSRVSSMPKAPSSSITPITLSPRSKSAICSRPSPPTPISSTAKRCVRKRSPCCRISRTPTPSTTAPTNRSSIRAPRRQRSRQSRPRGPLRRPPGAHQGCARPPGGNGRSCTSAKIEALCKVVGAAHAGGSKGNSYMKSLEENCPPNVEFVGFCSGNEIGDVYRSADILCCPSVWQEPFGNVNVRGHGLRSSRRRLPSRRHPRDCL